MDAIDNISEIMQTAKQTVAAPTLERGQLIALLNGNGGFDVVDLEKYSDTPARQRGNTTLFTAESFIQVFEELKEPESLIFLDRNLEKPQIVGVLNPHLSTGAGWNDHTATLVFRETAQAKLWRKKDGQMMGQGDFASFIEDNLADVVSPGEGQQGPSPAQMLELAQDLVATIGTSFRASERLHNGQRKVTIDTEIAAKIGKTDISVPEFFYISIQPFEVTSTTWRQKVRFRFRPAGDGTVTMGYVMDRWLETLGASFTEVDDILTSKFTGKTVYGQPLIGAAGGGRS